MYKPKIIIDVNAEQMSRLREREKEREEREKVREKEREREEMRALEEERRRKQEELKELTSAKNHQGEEVLQDVNDSSSDDDRGADLAPASNHNSPSDQVRHIIPPPIRRDPPYLR